MLPQSYWRFGWDRRLDFAAKYFYLISLAETKQSPFYPWWRKNLNMISKQYGCARPNIGAGARELANFNLIERLIFVPKDLESIRFFYPRFFMRAYFALRQKEGGSSIKEDGKNTHLQLAPDF